VRAHVLAVVAGTALAVACGGSPTAPSDGARAAARLTRTRFMAFGDSLVVGDPAAPQASWPVVLQARLRSQFPSQASSITVTNAGVGGERLTAGVLRFEEAFDAARPEAVLLMEGVNDLLSLGPETSTTLLQFMTQQAMSRNARVFVASMLPTVAVRRLSQPVPNLELLNGRIEQMCRQQGAIYVDLYNQLLPEAEAIIGSDGLHPTESGYRRIADVFLSAIRGALEVR
jgi:lysophospholipase L1-like esterase